MVMMGVKYMSVSKGTIAGSKRKHKKIKMISKILCLFLVFIISVAGGFMIEANMNKKDVKVLGASVNENKNSNNQIAAIVDKNEVDKKTEGKINNKTDDIKQGPEGENISKKADSSNNVEKEPSAPAFSNSSYAVKVEDAFKNDGKKTAFLTFDDGPSKDITPKILSILEKNNIKATFFVTGKNAQENKELLIQEYNSGHAIGNHSYSHNYNTLYSSIDVFKQEFDSTNNILKSILGEKFNSRLFRFPGGSFEKYKNPYKDFLIGKGYVYIDWNALNGDAEGIGFSADRLINRFKNTANGKEHLVILMHDAGGKKSTAEALPTIIEYLKANGYEFRILK
jgi:peptidoglycan/xylan/chitin deacetylase (PgdA/CDA1 family)